MAGGERGWEDVMGFKKQEPRVEDNLVARVRNLEESVGLSTSRESIESRLAAVEGVCLRYVEKRLPTFPDFTPAPGAPILGLVSDSTGTYMMCTRCKTEWRHWGGSQPTPGDPCPKCVEKKTPISTNRYPWTHLIGFKTWIEIQSMNLSWEEAWLYTTDRVAFDVYWKGKQAKKDGE
jgi:hypothetical protein